MQSLLREWEARCSQSPAAIRRHRPARLRAGHVCGQSPDRISSFWRRSRGARSWPGVLRMLLAGVLGVVASTLTAIWLRGCKTALMAGLYGYNGVLVGLALATFLAQGSALLDLCRAGRGGLDRGDAWDGERAEAVRGPCADSPLCCGHLDHAARSSTASPASRAPRCRLRGSLRLSSRPSRLGLEPISPGRSYRSPRCF